MVSGIPRLDTKQQEGPMLIDTLFTLGGVFNLVVALAQVAS